MRTNHPQGRLGASKRNIKWRRPHLAECFNAVSSTVVIAPDKFKGSLTATEAAQALQCGVLAARPDARTLLCPMADGGEGTVDVFLERGATRKSARVHGPRGKVVEAVYALTNGTAVLEMASASGLGLLAKSEYDPMHADTFGTGELIRAALDARAKRLIIGIGGSATNDAGIGMLRALGVRFLGADGAIIGTGIAPYEQLATIDLHALDPRLADVRIDVAVDVDNPLCGNDGAARTFAPQKGASPEDIAVLDRVLEHIADVAEHTLRRDCRNAPGAGAAGGLGFALLAFLGATMEPGVALIAREWDLGKQLDGATLCMTGEGKIDEQTLHGKTVWGVGELARARNVRVIAFGGAIDPAAVDGLEQRGISVVRIAPEGMSAEDSIRKAGKLLEASAKAVALRTLP
jgi:glycerate 2-kinase